MYMLHLSTCIMSKAMCSIRVNLSCMPYVPGSFSNIHRYHDLISIKMITYVGLSVPRVLRQVLYFIVFKCLWVHQNPLVPILA